MLLAYGKDTSELVTAENIEMEDATQVSEMGCFVIFTVHNILMGRSNPDERVGLVT